MNRILSLLLYLIFSICSVQASKDFKLDTVIILGAGSDFGAKYKINIFEEIRPLIKNLYLCELYDNPLSDNLAKTKLVDDIIKVSSYDQAQTSIIKYIKDRNLKPSAIVTYRDEWLELCSILSKKYNLPGNDLIAIENTRNKYQMLSLLKKSDLVSREIKLSTLQELKKYPPPFFIKPNNGMRSEWARFIYTDMDLKKYIQDIEIHSVDELFLIEDIVHGHEIDVDIVIYEGCLLYAKVSDNFPTYKPYALETGHLMPSLLKQSLQKKIINKGYTAATKCGYKSGVFHIEMIVKPSLEIELIEVNARVGGMYIPMWHKKIYNADLIKSTLAIAAGINPKPFLSNSLPKFALAQICITSNSTKELNTNTISKIKWENFDEIVSNKNIFSASKWIKDDYSRDIAINGHVNIGEITLESTSIRDKDIENM